MKINNIKAAVLGGEFDKAFEKLYGADFDKASTHARYAEAIDEFVALTANLLSDEPLFFLLNSYTTGLSASTMKYITSVRLLSKRGGYSEADELGLPVGDSGLALPCGSSVRVTFKK